LQTGWASCHAIHHGQSRSIVLALAVVCVGIEQRPAPCSPPNKFVVFVTILGSPLTAQHLCAPVANWPFSPPVTGGHFSFWRWK